MNCSEMKACVDQCLMTLQETCDDCLQNLGCSAYRQQSNCPRDQIESKNKPSQGNSCNEEKIYKDKCQRNFFSQGILKSPRSAHSHEKDQGTLANKSFASDQSASKTTEEKVTEENRKRKFLTDRKDDRPHRFSVYKAPDVNWTEEEEELLEAAVVAMCDKNGLRTFWVDKRGMKDRKFIHVQDGVFWMQVAKLVPGKDAAECFERYSSIQASSVARFSVRSAHRAQAPSSLP